MAAPDPSDKIKGKEYTNWLKVTLALYYMKSGLHTFIQSEVDCLHQSLLKKIHGGPTVPLPPCTMCQARCIIRNKYSGVWTFQKQCKSYCDVWIYELLKFHTNPNSDKIYWDNSHVPSWPFKSWECAKVFMPRGQTPSNVGPTECDSQALLTLLSSCTHFHSKLSLQGRNFLHAISTIRNKVMHASEMKVSDADRMSFMQQIIQLLEDPVHLKPLEDCKTAVENIHKITNCSLDVFFDLDNEIKALSETISDIRREHGMEVEKTGGAIKSLKEEYRELRELQMKRHADFEIGLQLHGTRMDTIERDIKQQERNLHDIDKTVSSHEGRLGVVEKDVDIIYKSSEELKTNTIIALQQQDKKHQDMDTTVKQLSESVQTMSSSIASCEERIVIYEDKVQSIETTVQNYEIEKKASKESGNGTSGALTRRKESNGLVKLKNQTEDILDTFRKMGFIPTTQTEEAKKLLQEKRSVVIKGNPGEGKTSTALHLIDSDDYKNQRVVVSTPKQWKKVDTDWVKIVVLEDIFGQNDIDHGLLQEWINDCLQTIQKHVDVGKLQVIITIRDDIMLKASSKLKSFKLFFSDMSLTLSSEKLTNSDKMSILNRELNRNNKDLNVDEKEQCIANFLGLIGFPQCCSLFAGNEDLFGQGPRFFKSPEKFFIINISTLEPNCFLSLAFLFCNGQIEEEYLSPSQIENNKNYLLVLKDLTSCLCISLKESTMTSLRKSYDHFLGQYVKRVFLYEHHSGGNISYEDNSGEQVSKSYVHFFHASVYDAVGKVLGDKCPEMVVKYSDPQYLYQRTCITKATDATSQNVFIPVSLYGLLVERMIDDVVEKRLVKSVVKFAALKQEDFLIKLKHKLQNSNKIVEFLMASSRSENPQNVSEGECITFLQYILQSDNDTVRLVYSHFMEFLICTHSERISDCWQCKEKQELLELALFYHHFEIAGKLITMNACYTHISLCNAARHGDLSRVQAILEYIKKRQVFNPECTEAKQALSRASMSGNQYLKEMLLEEGITQDNSDGLSRLQHPVKLQTSQMKRPDITCVIKQQIEIIYQREK